MQIRLSALPLLLVLVLPALAASGLPGVARGQDSGAARADVPSPQDNATQAAVLTPPGPAETVQAFFTALVSGLVTNDEQADLLVIDLKKRFFVASAEYADMADFGEPELILSLYGLGDGPRIEFVNMACAVEEQGEASATVRVAYGLRVTLNDGRSLEGDKEDRLVPLALEEGVWKIEQLR